MSTENGTNRFVEHRAHRLALLFRALESMDRELAEYKTEWKSRKAKLENELAALTDETLSGQLQLPIEGEKPPNVPVELEGARTEAAPAATH